MFKERPQPSTFQCKGYVCLLHHKREAGRGILSTVTKTYNFILFESSFFGVFPFSTLVGDWKGKLAHILAGDLLNALLLSFVAVVAVVVVIINKHE